MVLLEHLKEVVAGAKAALETAKKRNRDVDYNQGYLDGASRCLKIGEAHKYGEPPPAK